MRELMEVMELVGFWVLIGAVAIGAAFAFLRRRPQARSEERRMETIRCPECRQHQDAEIVFQEWMPFPAYAHQCVYCEYWITESEWETV